MRCRFCIFPFCIRLADVDLDFKIIKRCFIACLFGLVMTFAIAFPASALDCKSLSYFERTPSGASAPEGAACKQYLTLNASMGVSCHWTFSLRDRQATHFADAIWSEIKMCRDGQASASDLRVNHPDSYALREWISDAGIFSVSVKDKIALDNTLVFIRFSQRQE